jgi:hypothetical protein
MPAASTPGSDAHAGDDLLEDFAAFCLPRFLGEGTIVGSTLMDAERSG